MNSEEINILINNSLKTLDNELLDSWNQIKIEPLEWSLEIKEDVILKFWVVAIIGNEVIWYNNKSKGFNISNFKTDGVILEYYDDDTSLSDLIWHIF